MPTIYIADETRRKLDRLTAAERRGIALEIDLLCDLRIKELNIPDVNPSSGEGNNSSKSGQ